MDDIQKKSLSCDYKTVFTKTDAGMNVLDDLSRMCRENQSPYVPGSFDGTAKNCGIQEVIRYIRSMIALDVEEQRQTETIN